MGIDKILIADKDFALVNRLKNGLQQFNQFIVLTAPNGKHALRLLTLHKISLAVIDLDLPNMNGLELLASISRKFPNVLCIVTTSHGQVRLKKMTTGDCLFNYLIKPYDHVRLHNEIIKALDCRDEIAFKPGLYPVSLLPLVRISKKNCQLEFTTTGGKTGILTFEGGKLIDASFGEKKGNDALKIILVWEPCKFRFKDLSAQRNDQTLNNDFTSQMLRSTGLQPAGIHKPIIAGNKAKEAVEIFQLQGEKNKKALPRCSTPCKVLIVDDSVLMCKTLNKVLSTDTSIEIIGEVGDSRKALELIKQTMPDVVLLDIKPPTTDGMTTLKHLMIQAPTPTIMFSALTREGASITFDTLKYGAVDFMAKPATLVNRNMEHCLDELVHRIHHAAEIKIESAKYVRPVKTLKKKVRGNRTEYKWIVCMGTAEGGYATLLKIIPRLSPDLPVAHLIILNVIPQHVDAFINYLDRHCIIRIKRAVHGLPVEGATCYFASGKECVTLTFNESGKLVMHVKQPPTGADFNPINTLMFSAAEKISENAIGVVLTGSGNDGTEGLREIKRSGGKAIIQNPVYCLYKEMVENARKHIDKKSIFPETKIADTLNKICSPEH